MNSDYELFVFNGHIPKPNSKMSNNDSRFPPDDILENGADAIRKYWNMKNLKKRKKID